MIPLLRLLKYIFFTVLYCREVKFVWKNLNFPYPNFFNTGSRNAFSRSSEDLFKMSCFLFLFLILFFISTHFHFSQWKSSNTLEQTGNRTRESCRPVKLMLKWFFGWEFATWLKEEYFALVCLSWKNSDQSPGSSESDLTSFLRLCLSPGLCNVVRGAHHWAPPLLAQRASQSPALG